MLRPILAGRAFVMQPSQLSSSLCVNFLPSISFPCDSPCSVHPILCVFSAHGACPDPVGASLRYLFSYPIVLAAFTQFPRPPSPTPAAFAIPPTPAPLTSLPLFSPPPPTLPLPPLA